MHLPFEWEADLALKLLEVFLRSVSIFLKKYYLSGAGHTAVLLKLMICNVMSILKMPKAEVVRTVQ